MGHVEVDVVMTSPEGVSVNTKALVDTGATLTVIPDRIAKRLKLRLAGEKVKVATAKGSDQLDLTHVTLEIDGKKRILPALVSRHIDRVLLGVIALEAMQLRVNPITEKLEEYSALLYRVTRN